MNIINISNKLESENKWESEKMKQKRETCPLEVKMFSRGEWILEIIQLKFIWIVTMSWWNLLDYPDFVWNMSNFCQFMSVLGVFLSNKFINWSECLNFSWISFENS